ncbi:MAG: hypothetical protein RI947_206 [Candidatus Parcubacteria bacterium]
MKTLVTHIRPDLDALASSWLIRRYMPGWSEARMAFVPAGKTLDNKGPDADADIIHVDTGRGNFDHHQFKAKLSATLIVFNYLNEHKHIPTNDIAALKRLADFANIIDNFGEVDFPSPDADVYDLSLGTLIDGVAMNESDDSKLASYSYILLDAAASLLKKKVEAEQELPRGITFDSAMGKSLGLSTTNEETVKLAQKKGYQLVVRKDPDRGFVRLKTPPNPAYDLTPIYNKLKEADPDADWFLHSSLNMLLNGSSKNPNVTPSKLQLNEIIDIVKNTR